jgi:hypothetical protein
VPVTPLTPDLVTGLDPAGGPGSLRDSLARCAEVSAAAAVAGDGLSGTVIVPGQAGAAACGDDATVAAGQTVLTASGLDG